MLSWLAPEVGAPANKLVDVGALPDGDGNLAGVRRRYAAGEDGARTGSHCHLDRIAGGARRAVNGADRDAVRAAVAVVIEYVVEAAPVAAAGGGRARAGLERLELDFV